MQQDPLEYVDGANLYQYCRNSPIGSTDPQGRIAVWIPIVGGAAAIVGGYYLYRWITDPTKIQDLKLDCKSICAALKGYKNAREALGQISGESPPAASMQDLTQRLANRGIHQVGQMFAGVTGAGNQLSPGQQKIVKLVESTRWTAAHPDAVTHPGASFMQDNQEYTRMWIDAEEKRLDIVISEIEEAKKKNCCICP